MKKFLAIIMLTCGIGVSANADIWMWTDEANRTHFVDSEAAIYTWLDDNGKRFYADVPGHPTAVRVELVWHSDGDLADLQEGGGDTGQQNASNDMYADETPEERFEREQAEAYYCKRAQEIYDSYLNAPRLYQTGEDGTREYLTEEEMGEMLTETKAKVDTLCRGS